MGCFLACFGGAEDRKRRRRPGNRRLTSHQESCRPLRQSPPRKQPSPEAAIDVSVPELREKPEQESLVGSRKKVTFDLNVKTYEDVILKDSVEVGDEDKEAGDVEVQLRHDESRASPAAYPVNHRYQNCGSSDDEDDMDGDDEELEYDDCTDEEEEGVGLGGTEEESYESFFSLQLEKDKQSFREVNSPKPVKVSSVDREPEAVVAKGNARDRSQYVHSVLNPVENLTQWKEVKEHKVPMKGLKKENINLGQNVAFSSEPKIEKPETPTYQKSRPEPSTKQEISVDASLSTWLVSAGNSMAETIQETTTSSLHSNSSVNREESPILGALTVEDIKQSSVTSSPRKSPSRNPDDIPIVGSVGSYWSSSASSRITTASDTKGIPNTTSKYREDKVVNWNSTPFETRLERALQKGAAAEAGHAVC